MARGTFTESQILIPNTCSIRMRTRVHVHLSRGVMESTFARHVESIARRRRAPPCNTRRARSKRKARAGIHSQARHIYHQSRARAENAGGNAIKSEGFGVCGRVYLLMSFEVNVFGFGGASARVRVGHCRKAQQEPAPLPARAAGRAAGRALRLPRARAPGEAGNGLRRVGAGEYNSCG